MATLYELLPEEVLMEILSRIPAKSLLRFKSVSKYWYSLIQNPSFISLHHTRAKPYYCISVVRTVDNHPFKCSMYLDPNETLFVDLDLSFATRPTPHPDENFDLRGSCNGLMCLSFRSTIVICNPATREFRVLPQPPYCTLDTTDLGFAFDTKTNDYKVLRLSMFFDVDICHKIQIYSASSDSWKEIVATMPRNTLPLHHPFILLDGFFYWLSCNRSTSVCVIDSLNVVEGLFLRRSLPIGVGSDSRPNLCLLNGSLALVAPKYDGELGETCFDVWLMDEYGVECWTKTCTIGPLLGNQRAFGFWPNNEVLLTGCVNGGLIVSYNHNTRDIKEYQQMCNLPGRTYLMQVFPYSESLVSVKRRVDVA